MRLSKNSSCTKFFFKNEVTKPIFEMKATISLPTNEENSLSSFHTWIFYSPQNVSRTSWFKLSITWQDCLSMKVLRLDIKRLMTPLLKWNVSIRILSWRRCLGSIPKCKMPYFFIDPVIVFIDTILFTFTTPFFCPFCQRFVVLFDLIIVRNNFTHMMRVSHCLSSLVKVEKVWIMLSVPIGMLS